MSKIILSNPIPIKLSPKMLNESVENKEGRMIFPSIIQRADEKNQNTRVYPKSTLKREISKFIEGPIAEKRAYGELDHSEKTVVEFKNACIHINEIWWENNDIWGLIEVLDTPSGKIVQEVLTKGFSAGISSRGVGSVTELDENTVEVDDDFSLIAWDIVTNPSTYGAFLQTKSINESVELVSRDKVDEILTDILCQNLGFCSCQLKN